jgi:hypothetical protein
MNDNVKNKKIYYFAGGLLALLLLSATVLFSLGYRVTENFSIAKNGYMTINIPLPNTTVIINETKKIITSKDNEIIKVSLPQKAHSLIIHHESFYPWIKEIKVSSNKVTEVSPIFVYQSPSGSIITKNDSEYWKIVNNINKNFLPRNNSPKKSVDGSVSIWVEENKILAKIGEEIIEVVKPEETILNLDFYKNRNDSVLFSAGNGVYVIEINKEGTQNFMPIYKGQKPSFYIDNDNYVFIQDSQNLMQVII